MRCARDERASRAAHGWRALKRAFFSLFPQVFMSHQRRVRLRLVSKNAARQVGDAHSARRPSRETWPRVWAQERFRDIVRWREPESGGHFPSLEMPEAFIEDVRAGLATVSR